MPIVIDVKCSVCGKELAATCVQDKLLIEPCKNCIANERDEAYSSGHDDGYYSAQED